MLERGRGETLHSQQAKVLGCVQGQRQLWGLPMWPCWFVLLDSWLSPGYLRQDLVAAVGEDPGGAAAAEQGASGVLEALP